MNEIKLRPTTKEALDNMMDTFTGADGCVKFVLMRNTLIALDKQACDGDVESQTLIDIFTQFSRLIDVFSK